MKNSLILIVGSILLFGCVGQKGAIKYYLKHNDQLSELCAAKFPILERISPGKPVQTIDTLYLPGVTIPCPEVTNPNTGEKSTPMVKCPDQKVIHDKTTIRDTVYKENTAKLAALKYSTDKTIVDLQGELQTKITANSELKGDLNSSEKSLDKAKKRLTTNTWTLGILVLTIIGMGILLIKK
jgi:hypothetical protein